MPEEHPSIKVADKLGEVIAGHVQATHKAAAADELASRTAFVRELLANASGDVKPALRDALAGVVAAVPEDHPMRKLFELFGSPEHDIVEWVIDVLGIVWMAKTVMADVGTVQTQFVLNNLWSDNPELPLSPADLANAVVQGIVGIDAGITGAAKTGVSSDNFEVQVQLTGMPPSLQDLFQMYRRQIIPIGGGGYDDNGNPNLSVELGIKQGRTKDMWIEAYTQLAHTWPQPDEFVSAAVREQVGYELAKDWAGKAGLDVTTELAPGLTFFDLMFDTSGRPPGPETAARMAHRGIIEWTGSGPAAVSFAQAIAESDLKTKWTPALRADSAYVPAVSEVKQLFLHGAIDNGQAVHYLAMNGVDEHLATAILYLAEQEYVAQDKSLAKADIQAMYVAGEVTYSEALSQLDVIGYRGTVGEWVLELANVKKEQRVLQRGVTQVTNEVVKGFVSSDTGAATLAGMGVPADQITWLVGEWAWERTLQRKQPSASQVAKAWQYGGLTESEAMAYLAWLGYPPFDAYILLTAEGEAAPAVKPPMPALPAPWPPQDTAGNIIYPSSPAAPSQPHPPGQQPPPVPGVIPPPPPFPAQS